MSAFVSYFTNIHKTSKISSQCSYTPHHTVLPPDHFLAHAHFLPVVGVEPNRCQPSPDSRHHAVVVAVPARQASSQPWCPVGHTMPIGGTTVSVLNHTKAGARHWPRPRRLDTILISLLMGVAHGGSVTILNLINRRGIRMVGYHTHLIYCNRIIIYLNKNRVILSTRLTFLVASLGHPISHFTAKCDTTFDGYRLATIRYFLYWHIYYPYNMHTHLSLRFFHPAARIRAYFSALE